MRLATHNSPPMPAAVERALIEKLGWRNRPNPVDLYAAVYEVLEAMQAKGGGVESNDEPTPAEFLDRVRARRSLSR